MCRRHSYFLNLGLEIAWLPLPTFCLKRLSSPGHTYLQRRQHTGTGELGLGLKRPHSTGVSDRGGIVEG